jgi:hypothetical protein
MQLALPSGYKMCNVFHVSLLKAAKGTDAAHNPPPALFAEDGEAMWEVSRVVGHRTRKRGRRVFTEFLVRWHGYGLEDDT